VKKETNVLFYYVLNLSFRYFLKELSYVTTSHNIIVLSSCTVSHKINEKTDTLLHLFDSNELYNIFYKHRMFDIEIIVFDCKTFKIYEPIVVNNILKDNFSLC